MRMEGYLGKDVTELLNSIPFKDWVVERSVTDDLDERVVHYVFDGNGLELRCDGRERVSAIFLHASDCGGFDESLAEIPFALSRHDVLARFGVAEKSGERISDPILGECGAWDRFVLPNCVIHCEYKTDVDEINKITLIRKNVVL